MAFQYFAEAIKVMAMKTFLSDKRKQNSSELQNVKL